MIGFDSRRADIVFIKKFAVLCQNFKSKFAAKMSNDERGKIFENKVNKRNFDALVDHYARDTEEVLPNQQSAYKNFSTSYKLTKVSHHSFEKIADSKTSPVHSLEYTSKVHKFFFINSVFGKNSFKSTQY